MDFRVIYVQIEPESGAYPHLTDNMDLGVVFFDDILDNGKAQTGALEGVDTVFHPEESFEDSFLILWGNTYSCIIDFYSNMSDFVRIVYIPMVVIGPYHYYTTFWGKFEGIVYQIAKNL